MKPSDRRRYEAYVDREIEALERQELRRYDKEAGYQTKWEIFLSFLSVLGIASFWIIKVSLAVAVGVGAFCITLVTSAVKAFRETRKK